MPTEAIPRTMKAVVTTRPGGLDALAYQDVPVPRPAPTEVLLRVLASSVNNTDINTRVGWYDPVVNAGTVDAVQASAHPTSPNPARGWRGLPLFPLIQGTDCCGRVVHVGHAQNAHWLGKRVLVRPCLRSLAGAEASPPWLGSDVNGAFAQYLSVPVAEIFAIESDLSDVELGTVPCIFGTAENMLMRADVGKHDHVIVTGASGGVGSAVVQLARSRGATVTAITSYHTLSAVAALGASHVADRADLSALSLRMASVVVDTVGGCGVAQRLGWLKTHGRYVTAGAVAGAHTTFDLRQIYLKDLSLLGCTTWVEPVFDRVISALQSHSVRPVLAASYPLKQLPQAQQAFLEKSLFGKLAITP